MKAFFSKNILKVVAVNIAVIFLLAVSVEIILQLVGADSIHEEELKRPGWQRKYKERCDKISKEKFEIYNSFYTDAEGIFKANPEYDFNSDKRFIGEHTINSDGFRGNEFTINETPARKILLIGDSFVWGASAEPITECFADLIQDSGYYVYNAGIGGTDPVQYAKIAEKYSPRIKPDVVIVCIYLGNDIRHSPHPVMPGKNLFYDTNFGWLLGYNKDGRYFENGREAFMQLKKRICGQCNNLWDLFIYKTVLGKAVYKLFKKRKSIHFPGDRQWVTNSLKKIRQVCSENGAEFLLFLLPTAKRMESKANSIKYNAHIFKDFKYYYPRHLKEDDYCKPPNDHFNNRGHKKIADYIVDVLKKNGYLPETSERTSVRNKERKKGEQD